ncbi:hypothetical protein WBP07_21965 (plasmid) [Novosphingobium sp. BL-8A]|uniref:hypothetical protein n=1 Tax=Novosphingobium sp. BL-8A TaxID=3127639 RepID=UPI003756ACE9
MIRATKFFHFEGIKFPGWFKQLPARIIIRTADSTISTLNGQIKTTLDSMKGYEDAAKDAESTQFATMFAEFEGTAARRRPTFRPKFADWVEPLRTTAAFWGLLTGPLWT